MDGTDLVSLSLWQFDVVVGIRSTLSTFRPATRCVSGRADDCSANRDVSFARPYSGPGNCRRARWSVFPTTQEMSEILVGMTARYNLLREQFPDD